MTLKTNNKNSGANAALMITGGHRSGTSALTRVCNLLGVELGPDLLPPGPDNPRGYWEHRAILRLHERALEQLGSSWDDCRALPDDWLSDPVVDPFRDAVREILERDFAHTPLWGVKDPRLCRLVPLWQDVLSKGATPIAYLIALRHPLEVAASLTARNGFPHEQGMLLWLRYNLELERHSRGQPRVFIRYDNLLDNWQAVMSTISAELHLTWPVAPARVARDVNTFLTQDLRHHVVASDGSHQHNSLPALIREAYSALLVLSENDANEGRARLDRVSSSLARAQILYDPALGELLSKKVSLERDIKKLRARHAELGRGQAQANKRIRALEAEREKNERDLEGLQSNVAELEHELEHVYASKSWWLTRPIRESARVFLNATEALARRIEPEPIVDHVLFDFESLPDDAGIRLHVDKALVADGRLEVRGWAFHDSHDVTAGMMILNDSAGEHRVPLHIGVKRVDVHAAWGSDHALFSGFRITAPLYKPPKDVWIEFEIADMAPIRAPVYPWYERESLIDRRRIAEGVSGLLRGDWRYLRDHRLWLNYTRPQTALVAPDSLTTDPAGHIRVDRALIGHGRLEISGWAFHEDYDLIAGVIILDGAAGQRRVPLRLNITRGDVHAAWGHDSALHSGFQGAALLNGKPEEIWIEFNGTGAESLRARVRPRRDRISLTKRYAIANGMGRLLRGDWRYLRDRKLWLRDGFDLHDARPVALQAALDLLNREPHDLTLLRHPVDIIIPVYNGFDYLVPLFRSIKQNTRSTHRLIVIDDASPDGRVWSYLQEAVRAHSNALLLRNERNRGFVASVNHAASHVAGDFALLNTDVEVPSGWLERLMAPIEADRTIASTTPFTNAGTICSFPSMNVDNPPFANLNVECIDRWFRRVRANLPIIELPTGIGFCMGINGDVWRRIGSFDEKTFGRGYGEENDWCLRAQAKNYRNIMTPNLFIHHKHGGSFDTPEREDLRDKNLRRVQSRYPHYQRLVAAFVRKDPAALLRKSMTMLIACGEAAHPPVLIIDHEQGGGANAYRRKLARERLAAGQPVLLLTARHETDLFAEVITLSCLYQDYSTSFEIEDLSALESLFANHSPLGEIFYNNLVTYRQPMALLHALHRLKLATRARLTLAIHDFYPLCPSYNLLHADRSYCGLPDIETCRDCLPRNRFALNPEGTEIEHWRGAWAALFKIADKVLCFSEDSRRHVVRIYPACAARIEVHPHQLNVRFARQPRLNHEGPLHVGVVGAIGYAKGAKVVADLAHHLLKAAPEARITVIGILDNAPALPNLTVTGPYKPEELPDTLERHGVNVCFVPSIWPETFSYVTAELMAIEVPIAYFDIGAPAERLREYPHARPIPTGFQADMAQLTRCLTDTSAAQILDCASQTSGKTSSEAGQSGRTGGDARNADDRAHLHV